jgi:hypothetical protein
VESLSRDLAEVDLELLTQLPRWDDCIELALELLTTPDQADRVLRAWLPQISKYVRLADIVLFRRVRLGILFAPMSIEVHQAWIAACVVLALRSRDPSLLESLVYTLRGDLTRYPELLPALAAVRRESPRLDRALLQNPGAA